MSEPKLTRGVNVRCLASGRIWKIEGFMIRDGYDTVVLSAKDEEQQCYVRTSTLRNEKMWQVYEGPE